MESPYVLLMSNGIASMVDITDGVAGMCLVRYTRKEVCVCVCLEPPSFFLSVLSILTLLFLGPFISPLLMHGAMSGVKGLSSIHKCPEQAKPFRLSTKFLNMVFNNTHHVQIVK